MTRVHAWVLLLLLVSLVRPAPGAGRGISLRLQKVNASEALLALQQASGVPLELASLELPDDHPAAPRLRGQSERTSFSWQNASLGEALRAVADRYGMYCQPRRGGGFVLWPSPKPLERRPPSPYAAQVQGLRLEVRQVRVIGDRPAGSRLDKINLELIVRATAGVIPPIVTLDNLVARDDRGGVLLPDARPRLADSSLEMGRTFPDEWHLTVPLNGLQPGATRLTSLEGDLITVSTTKPQRCEVPLPLPEGGVERRLHNLRVEVLSLLSSGVSQLGFPPGSGAEGPGLRARVTYPAGTELYAPNGMRGSNPLLVGASGRTYAPRQTWDSVRTESTVQLSSLATGYPIIDEAVTAVRLDVAERGQPQLAGRFRVAGIPLPVANDGVPGLAQAGALPGPPEDPAETKVEEVSLSFSRVLELLPKPERRNDGQLWITLNGVVGGVERQRLAGLRNVVACDERGNRLAWHGSNDLYSKDGEPFQGLTWRQTVRVAEPPSRARSLAWVQGELHAFARMETAVIELAAPPPGGAQWESGPVRVELVSLRSGQPAFPGGPVTYDLEVAATGPQGTRFEARGANRRPVLIGRSGTVYTADRDSVADNDSRWEVSCRYTVREPVEKVRLELAILRDPEPVLTFCLRNIPLPEDLALPAPIPAVPPRNPLPQFAPRPARPHPYFSSPDTIDIVPFWQEGGARLLLPVRRGDRPAVNGSLLVGFERKTATGWSARRWTEVPVADGVARLEEILPGTYRIVGAYHPAGTARGGAPAAPFQITLGAGKQALAPVLHVRSAP